MNAQKKISKARERATKKYVAKQWRPSMYIDKELQPEIEKHFKDKGYKSFNEYVIDLVLSDMGIEQEEK